MDTRKAHLITHPNGSTLVVDGSPMLLLGGQVHNSSTSCAESIEATFEKAAALGYNFVIGPLSWSQFEPEEGVFDTSLLAKMLETAEKRKLKLVIIWFGAYKNAGSTYAPGWVRRDRGRFPRAQTTANEVSHKTTAAVPVLSVFSEELLLADKSAFSKAMEFLADRDVNSTVIMIQVENEVGILRTSRDYSEASEAAWHSPVPEALLNQLAEGALDGTPAAEVWSSAGAAPSGVWTEVFGDAWQGHEIFMAWHFAVYVNALAAAGKQKLNIPMYVNAWLGPQDGQTEAGQWPSGGPGQNVLDIWKIAAPAIDFLSPDIYVPDALAQMQIYHRKDNPLFIPEARHTTGNLFWAIGNHAAIGYSMFGAEDGRVGNQMSEAYQILGNASTYVANAQADSRIASVLLRESESESVTHFGLIQVKASGAFAGLARFVEVAGLDLELRPFDSKSELEELSVSIPSKSDERPFGIIIQDSELEYTLIAKGIKLEFSHAFKTLEIDRIQEGTFKTGEWIPERELNGDERLTWVPMHNIGACKVRLVSH